MKKLLSLFLVTFFSFQVFAQNGVDSAEMPIYLRFPQIPEFTIYKANDSSTFSRSDLKKNLPTAFFIFSPDCEHCQHETEQLIKNINKFKKSQIVMITWLPWDDMKAFYKKYQIEKYPVITMARDTRFFFPPFFKVRNLPSIFIYDKKGNFKKSFEGTIGTDVIASYLK